MFTQSSWEFTLLLTIPSFSLYSTSPNCSNSFKVISQKLVKLLIPNSYIVVTGLRARAAWAAGIFLGVHGEWAAELGTSLGPAVELGTRAEALCAAGFSSITLR